MKNKTLLVIVFALIAVLAIGQFSAGAETGPTLEEIEAMAKAECESAGGTYESQGDGKAICHNLTEQWTVDRMCKATGYDYVTLYGDIALLKTPTFPLDAVYNVDCGNFPSLSLAGKGTAKIITIDSEAYLGGTIKVTGMGAPSFLRLKGNGTTYKLPLVLSSVKQYDDGTFTAEFYTIDPATSQPLVAPGKYKADIFGSNGPAGAQFDITITR